VPLTKEEMREYQRQRREKMKGTPYPSKPQSKTDEWIKLSEVQPAMLAAEQLLNGEIDRLTAEVARLKRELAARPVGQHFDLPNFGRQISTRSAPPPRAVEDTMREFHPVPKPGKKKTA
jgi:hypothetical protein